MTEAWCVRCWEVRHLAPGRVVYGWKHEGGEREPVAGVCGPCTTPKAPDPAGHQWVLARNAGWCQQCKQTIAEGEKFALIGRKPVCAGCA